MIWRALTRFLTAVVGLAILFLAIWAIDRHIARLLAQSGLR